MRNHCLLLGALVIAPGLFAAVCKAEGKKILMLTKSSAYEHSVVNRGPNGELGLAERTVGDLAAKNGIEIVITKDGGQINADNLKKFDAIFFYTQGELTDSGRDKQPPMKPEDRQAILDFISAGGGFVGTHCGGADTFHRWEEDGKKPFLEMVGGEFIGHGPQQVALVKVVDPNFPAVAEWPAAFSLHDEWYSYRGFTPDLHVIMMIQTPGMTGGRLYDREPYPITWCKNYGKGRMFYTGLGHRETVWNSPMYQKMIESAMLWAVGEIEADASPNLKLLFGDEKKALMRINPPQG